MKNGSTARAVRTNAPICLAYADSVAALIVAPSPAPVPPPPTPVPPPAPVPPPPAPIPPPTGWVFCADEHDTCVVPGTRTVRYGVSGFYATRTIAGSVVCDNAAFGDPAFGANKHCDYSADTSPTPAPSPSPVPPPPPVPVPPPVPSGLYPNKPAGYVLRSEIDFSQAVPAADGSITGAAGWAASDRSALSKVTSDGPESPPSAWRFTIPNVSWPSGGRGFGKIEGGAVPAGKAGYYFNWKVKLDANYLPHPYGEKFAAGFGSNGWLIDLKGFDWFTVFCYGCSQAQVPNWPALAVLDHNSPPLGQWLNVELLYEPGSSGRIRLWINGNLHVNFQGSVPALSGSSEHYIFQGGDGMTRDRVSWRDYDHISIWTAP